LHEIKSIYANNFARMKVMAGRKKGKREGIGSGEWGNWIEERE
jgi:hypothetical protein